jgi:LRR receptor-like serine/threonine-protein kinase FLS2
LESLDLGFNFFTGSLPMELQALTSLTSFAVTETALTGPFFEPFGAAWRNLKYLNLDKTLFTGTLPTAVLEQWSSSLVDLNLGLTMIHGSLPTAVNDLSQLTNLYLFGEAFGGSIPEFSNLEKLRKWPTVVDSIEQHQRRCSRGRFVRSKLTVILMPLYQTFRFTGFLTLEGGLFTGTIPTTLGSLANIEEISLRRMKITGTIPAELGNCSKLIKLVVILTELTGTIPTEIGNLQTLGKRC